MSIHRSNGSHPVNRAERAGEKKKSQGPNAAGEGGIQAKDRLELSPKAQEVVRLRDAAGEIPEIRQERVDSVREQIRLGRYGFDFGKLAQLLVASDVL